jgi:tetratricopeptide (TPR) repeat protein
MRHFQFPDLIPVLLAMLLACGSAGIASRRHWHRAEAHTCSVKPAGDQPRRRCLPNSSGRATTNQAKRISERIWARWRDSGSATANLLLQWADKAMVDREEWPGAGPARPGGGADAGLCRRLEPAGHPALCDGQPFDKSMADINRVLALEPRHFGAMAGMAAILAASGNDALALRAWEQMLEIYPANSQAQDQGWRTGRQARRQQDLIPETFPSGIRKEPGKPFQTKAHYWQHLPMLAT